MATQAVDQPTQLRRSKLRQLKAISLLAAAERLMQQGLPFNEIGIEALCEETGIARSTFYVYFQDKSDLVQALSKEIFKENLNKGHKWWDRAEERSKPLLVSAIKEILEFAADHAAMYQVIEETRSSDPVVAEMYEAFMRESISNAQHVIAKAQKSGKIRKNVTPDMVECLHWMVERSCTSREKKMSKKEMVSVADALSEIMWQCFYKE